MRLTVTLKKLSGMSKDRTVFSRKNAFCELKRTLKGPNAI